MVRYEAVIRTPRAGLRLGIKVSADALTAIDFLPDTAAARQPRSDAGRAIAEQLARYFDEPNSTFSMTLAPVGTAFQQRVWGALREIAPGNPCSYGALAQCLNTSARAVGGACRANPIPVVIPCHRVVSVAGLGGFMGRAGGDSVDIKRWLLAHEGWGDGERRTVR